MYVQNLDPECVCRCPRGVRPAFAFDLDRSLDGLLLCSPDLELDLLLLLTGLLLTAPGASSTTDPDGELDRDPSYL